MAARSRQHCFARQERRLAQSSQQFFSSTADQQGTGLTNTNLGPQLLANAGYAVLCPNIRGSTGYGYDFMVLNRGDWGGADFKDVMAGVDYLIAQGIADPQRLGVADRKSTRLNSSHTVISYAVFCLKKKKKKQRQTRK